MAPRMITPLFKTHYSIGRSLLTLDEPGKAKPGAPLSVFDLSQSVGMKEVVVVDDRIDGLIAAYKVADKLGVKLCYGLQLRVCANLADKTPASLATESKVILFMRSTDGHGPLIRIHNRAMTDGHFSTRHGSYGRADWSLLKAYWSDNLLLGLPFFGSFIARNQLSFASIVPDLPTARVSVFDEIDSRLPFAPLIRRGVERFAAGRAEVEVVPSKTVLYPTRAHFKAYVLKRCIANRSSWDSPDVNHLSSPEFSFQSWRELNS